MNNIESKYKVGDKVIVKSLDWYNSNKDENGEVLPHSDIFFVKEMSECCGKEFEVSHIYPDGEIRLKEYDWSDWMFEDDTDNNNKQQILEHIERVQSELDKLRALCNSK